MFPSIRDKLRGRSFLFRSESGNTPGRPDADGIERVVVGGWFSKMKSYVPEQPPAALSSVDRDCLFLTKPYRRATHPGYLSPLLEAALHYGKAWLAKIESCRIKSTEVAPSKINVSFFFFFELARTKILRTNSVLYFNRVSQWKNFTYNIQFVSYIYYSSYTRLLKKIHSHCITSESLLILDR